MSSSTPEEQAGSSTDVDDPSQMLEVLPATSQQNQCDIQGKNVNIGDRIIHTPGPVYTGPVTIEQHIVQPPSPPTASEIKEKCEELQAVLKDEVQSIATEKTKLIPHRKITPVNLSIVSKPQQIDDEFQAEGHYHSREALAKVYDRPSGDISPEEMFTRAKQTAQDEAEQKFESEQVKEKCKYVEKHGNVVGVVGQAGIGKTTSCKKWALQALDEDMFGKVSFIFYIVVRKINFETSMTFLRFLLHTMLLSWNYTPEVAQGIMQAINGDPDVLLVFDGVDEAAFKSFSSEAPTPLLDKENKAEVYLKHLLSGNLLPRSRKIFTSRPAPFYKLDSSHRPRFIAQILGLTPNSQRELGQQICGARYDSVEKKLEQNTNMFSYCTVPVNFILTVIYLMDQNDDIQFVSLTKVLSSTCVKYLQTGHRRKTTDQPRLELDKLSKLAWDGFRSKKVMFTMEDFSGIDESTQHAFLNTSIAKEGNLNMEILEGQEFRYFSHLIWQEFFAAIYLMTIMPLEEFKQQYEQFTGARWEVVSKFAFGIYQPSVFKDIKVVIPSCSSEDWKAKKTLLKELASSYMVDATEEAILRCCSWAHEANDEEITSIVSSSLPDDLEFNETSLLPTDLDNLSFVVQKRNKQLKLLFLYHNQIQDRGSVYVANCIHMFEKVYLRDSGLTSVGAKHLSEKIKLLKKPMELLSLSDNRLTDKSAESLADCVHNIKVLEAVGCSFTQAGKDLIESKTRGKVYI